MRHWLHQVLATFLIACLLPLSALAQDEHRLAPGDEIEVTVLTSLDSLTGYTRQLKVNDNGTVLLPFIGQISVAGKSVAAVTNELQQAYKKIFAFVSVGVQLAKAAGIDGRTAVYITGAVRQGGALSPPNGRSFSIVDLIGQAGGLPPEADAEHIQIYRAQGGMDVINFNQVLKDGSGHNITVFPGDTVRVPSNWVGTVKEWAPVLQTAISIVGFVSLITGAIMAWRPAPAPSN